MEYLCDNNKNLTALERAIELIADSGVRCVLIPSELEASYNTVDSLKNIKLFFDIAHGVQVFCAKEKHFYREDNCSVLYLHILMAEAESYKRKSRRKRKSDNGPIE